MQNALRFLMKKQLSFAPLNIDKYFLILFLKDQKLFVKEGFLVERKLLGFHYTWLNAINSTEIDALWSLLHLNTNLYILTKKRHQTNLITFQPVCSYSCWVWWWLCPKPCVWCTKQSVGVAFIEQANNVDSST